MKKKLNNENNKLQKWQITKITNDQNDKWRKLKQNRIFPGQEKLGPRISIWNFLHKQ